MIRRIVFLLAALALIATACGSSDTSTAADGGSSSSEAAADSTDPIIIPEHNWSSQLVGAAAVGKILERTGATVEYLPADSQVVYESMCQGDVTLVHEVWESSFGVAFEAQLEAGCVKDLTTHDALTREEWWYPSYMEEQCPGLPDWEALNNCAEMFSTAETGTNGRYLGGPIEWQKKDPERIEALGMNFQVVNAGSADAIWAELETAYANEEPIVNFNWTPNFVDALYDGGFIEFPEYEADCVDDPAWGTNPDAAYDCGNPKGGYLKIGVWEGAEAKWPNAMGVLSNINLTNLDIATMAKLVDIDGMEAEAAADKWLADNADRVDGWVG